MGRGGWSTRRTSHCVPDSRLLESGQALQSSEPSGRDDSGGRGELGPRSRLGGIRRYCLCGRDGVQVPWCHQRRGGVRAPAASRVPHSFCPPHAPFVTHRALADGCTYGAAAKEERSQTTRAASSTRACLSGKHRSAWRVRNFCGGTPHPRYREPTPSSPSRRPQSLLLFVQRSLSSQMVLAELDACASS
jgi:hypothetical protein